MLGEEELKLLAQASKRNQQLERDFEQICLAGMESMKIIGDLKLLLMSLASELHKVDSSSDLPNKVLLYLVKNDLLEDRVRHAILQPTAEANNET